MQQCRVAAHNMYGLPSIYNDIPLFCTRIMENSIRIAGIVNV